MCLPLDLPTDVYLFIYWQIWVVGNVFHLVLWRMYQRIYAVGNVVVEIKIKNWDSLFRW